MQKQTRVYLADDHRILREGVRHILSEISGCEVVGEAGDGRQALQEIARLAKADVGLEIAFAESDQWDHHANEGGATGQLAKRAQLRQTFVEANGHCALTQAEWTVAIEAMEKRLKTGVWPGNDFFPNNGNDLRFNNAFDAGQYPQPRLP